MGTLSSIAQYAVLGEVKRKDKITGVSKMNDTTKKYTVELTEEQLKQLGIEVEKPQWPSKSDEYYYIHADGDVVEMICSHSKYEKKLKTQGNIFRTKEEAEAESERRAIMQELRECEGVVEWKSGVLTNYISYYCHKDNYPNGKFETVSCDFQKDVNQVYFDTHEHAKAAIEKLGDTKLRKLFRIEHNS